MKLIPTHPPTPPRPQQPLAERSATQAPPGITALAKRTSAQADLPPSARPAVELRAGQNKTSTQTWMAQRQRRAEADAQGQFQPSNVSNIGEVVQALLQMKQSPSVSAEPAGVTAAGVAREVPQQEQIDPVSDSDFLATSASRPAAEIHQLQSLGYSKKQANAIKPESRSEVIKHHAVLTHRGFNLPEICSISNRAPSLGFLAQKYHELQRSLPDLTQSDAVDIARGRAGNLALEELLSVTSDLKAPPLSLHTEQLVKIAKMGERPALKAVHSLGGELTGDRYNLTPAQVVAIASHIGGKQALETVSKLMPELRGLGLDTAQVVAIASNNGGKQALEAVNKLMPELCSHGLDTAQVVAIASNDGGKQALETVNQLMPRLRGQGLATGQVVAIASNDGGKQALEAINKLMSELIGQGLGTAQVVAIASNNGGKQALEAVNKLMPELRSQGLDTAQVVAIASNKGGKQALEAVNKLMPVLVEEPNKMTREAVVALASQPGGRPALEDAAKARGKRASVQQTHP